MSLKSKVGGMGQCPKMPYSDSRAISMPPPPTDAMYPGAALRESHV